MTTITKDNNIMATANPDSDQIGSNNFSENSAEAQGSGQLTDVNPSPNSGFICSQLVSDPKPKASEKATTTTNNNNSNNSNSSSSSSVVSSNCSNSVLATVTKVVTSDEEQEDFLAEIDSDLPNFLSRTFMGQDARFSFILFFTVFSFSLVLGLFVIQASYAWHNYQLLEMLGREDFSEEFFYLHYYDPPEPLTDESPSPGLRVNTSFYVH